MIESELRAKQAEWQAGIREALFVPESPPDLAPQVHSQFTPTDGVRAERVSYGTQFGMRIPAILYLPDPLPRERVPALIIVNGHGGDKYSWYPLYAGQLYAKAGIAVLSYDPTGEGERNSHRESGTREHDLIEAPDELAQRLAGLMITDLLQGVAYLRQRGNTERIGAAGYSMGSFVLAMAGAISSDLHACVLVGGGNLDGVDEYWDNTKPMCTGTPYRSLQFLGDRGAVIYTLHSLRGPTLIYNGLLDTVVNIPDHGEPFFEDLRRRTIELRGSPDGVFETGFGTDVSHRPFFVTKPVAKWLGQNLGFPNWTEQDIEAMAETHIGTWSQEQDVETDPFYASEDREGGTPALGKDIPGIQRHKLHVYSDEEWENLKVHLVHESWREATRKLLSKSFGSQTR